MLNVRIPKPLWLRGKEAAENGAFLCKYVVEEGLYKADMLGMLLMVYGLDVEELKDKRLVSVIAHSCLQRNRTFPVPLDWIVTRSHADTEDCFELMRINDDPILKEEEREERIKLFLQNRGIRIDFDAYLDTFPRRVRLMSNNDE